MKELIDPQQAQLLMLGLLILAPLAGLAWGAAAKRLPLGLSVGVAVGGGNYALWTVYNAITEKLGLDTVKNLLVNLGLFIVIGAVIGLGIGFFAAKERSSMNTEIDTQGGDDGDLEGNRTG